MEAKRRTERSVNQTKMRNISEDVIVQQCICENLVFHAVYMQQIVKSVTKLEICICYSSLSITLDLGYSLAFPSL